jgi:hypothetical protein
MSTNNVALITEPSTNKTLTPIFVGATVAQLNARVTQLEEARPRINKMLQEMERLVQASLLKQRELEKYVQEMQDSFLKQDLQHKHNFDRANSLWTSVAEPIHARVEKLEIDQMSSDESYRALSNYVAIMQLEDMARHL